MRPFFKPLITTTALPASVTGIALPRGWRWGFITGRQVAEDTHEMQVCPVGRDGEWAGEPMWLPYDGRVLD